MAECCQWRCLQWCYYFHTDYFKRSFHNDWLPVSGPYLWSLYCDRLLQCCEPDGRTAGCSSEPGICNHLYWYDPAADPDKCFFTCNGYIQCNRYAAGSS